MTKELAKTLTTALVQFIDRERPEGSVCCSSYECEKIEKAFEGGLFDVVEKTIKKKLSGLTEFEQEVSDIVEYCKEHGENVAFDYAKRHAKTLLDLARRYSISGGIMGPTGPSCDPGRRGRMGAVPKEISKEAEAFQAQFPGPYDKDDIITAYETAKIKAMEDLPKWKEAKNCGKRECFVGSAFEATGRRYIVLYCYGYGISIEQLFEKLPKEDK